MEQIAPKYPMAEVLLLQAARHFAADAAALDEAYGLLGRHTPEGPDPERNRRSVEVLPAARDAYAAGIETITAALARMSQTSVG